MPNHPLFEAEGKLINSFMRINAIRAKVNWRKSVEVRTGYFRYGLEMDPRERFTRIEGAIRELSSCLGDFRRSKGINGELHVIPTTVPFPSLETPHPCPSILLPRDETILTGRPHTAALGRSYLSSPREEELDFEKTPHALVAGITNAGKSKLVQCLLTSLMARTSPADLRVYLIDLKNEDLLPLKNLPHIIRFAGTEEEALGILTEVDEEKEKRIADPERKPFRIVVAIDEMAHLAGNKDAHGILGRLATIGRSKWINLIGATQHPTREGGMGSLLKANFGVRYVGQVAAGQSQYATNRKGLHADYLPGKGAFLHCSGPDVYRFQSYFLTDETLKRYTSEIRLKWPYGNSVQGEAEELNLQNAEAVKLFPLDRTRALTPIEASVLRGMAENGDLHYRGEFSYNKAMMLVFDGRSPERKHYVIEALNRGR